MLFSRTCVNGIRAALQIAVQTKRSGREYVPVKEVAEEVNVSFHFLGKIAQSLIEAGILTSFRGPNGGIGLAKPARDIHLIDIVEALDGKKVFEQCMLGLPDCNENDPCPLHDSWSRSREVILKELRRETLASVIRKHKKLTLGA